MNVTFDCVLVELRPLTRNVSEPVRRARTVEAVRVNMV